MILSKYESIYNITLKQNREIKLYEVDFKKEEEKHLTIPVLTVFMKIPFIWIL